MTAATAPIPAAAAPAAARSRAAESTGRRRLRFGSALDRYVFVEFVKIFVVTALGFPVLVFVIDLVDSLPKYLERHITPAQLALSYVYWLPETMFNVLPAAVLFATVFTVGAVTRYSEITAAKASGISFYRFILPIVAGATLATGLGLTLGELAAPANARRLAVLKETHDDNGSARTNFAYAAEGARVYKVQNLSVDAGTLTGVEIDRKGNGPDYPGLLIAAERARWTAGRGWVLAKGAMHVLPVDSVRADTVHADTAPADARPTVAVARGRAKGGVGAVQAAAARAAAVRTPAFPPDLAFEFDSLADRQMTERPRDLMVTPKAPDDMDYRELGRFIHAMERSGADVNTLRVTRMLKIAIPVTCVIILLFGAPLATSTQRGGAAYGVGLSLGTTILFLVLIQLTKAVGGKGLIPPELAAWVPSVLFGLAGAVLLSRTRT
ncbi:hypothetical protein tb265_07180 [Gemmatimonadetes bacterium T265]|nr:hypothetical protein tb265_07180 [Gemmatimonadetes bacterium T265]